MLIDVINRYIGRVLVALSADVWWEARYARFVSLVDWLFCRISCFVSSHHFSYYLKAFSFLVFPNWFVSPDITMKSQRSFCPNYTNSLKYFNLIHCPFEKRLNLIIFVKKYDIDSTLYTLKWFFQCFLDRVPFSLTLRYKQFN